MRVKLTILLLLITIFNVLTVNANTEDEGSRHVRQYAQQATDMALLLNEYLYEIQPEGSTIAFRVDSPVGEVWASFHDFKGRFAMLSNGLHNGPAVVEINTESLDSDAGFIGTMLKSESFFDVENFPSIRFVGGNLEWYNDRQAVLKGEMTIHRVTRPVAFYVELVDADVENPCSQRITMKASTTIKRSAFGIDTLLPAVSDNVNLYMSIAALRKDTVAAFDAPANAGNMLIDGQAQGL